MLNTHDKYVLGRKKSGRRGIPQNVQMPKIPGLKRVLVRPTPGPGKEPPPAARLHPPQPQLTPRCRKLFMECKPVKECHRMNRINFRCPPKTVCCAEVPY